MGKYTYAPGSEVSAENTPFTWRDGGKICELVRNVSVVFRERSVVAVRLIVVVFWLFVFARFGTSLKTKFISKYPLIWAPVLTNKHSPEKIISLRHNQARTREKRRNTGWTLKGVSVLFNVQASITGVMGLETTSGSSKNVFPQ